jgi:SAM-dependent methyltransferase
MNCRHCRRDDLLPVVDLGSSPPSNAYPPIGTDPRSEVRFPLRVAVCPDCWLMQTEDFVARESMFTADYAYFSSYSSTWLQHAESYVGRMIAELDLGADDLVVEVASNDGYLLQFVQRAGVRALGIEPTAGTAAVARERGVPTIERFFGVALAEELAADGVRPRLMAANNVLAHVPDIDDFVAGFARLLHEDGVVTFEFPHLLVLLRDGLFDTIYHEHYSYLSLGAVGRILAENGLRVVDVEEIPTHGGSLRVHAVLTTAPRVEAPAVAAMIARERSAGLFEAGGYASLQGTADRAAAWVRELLERMAAEGRTVLGYGAAAKGTTLLNHARVDADLLPAVVDRNPAKQGRQMPGTGVPILPTEAVAERRPDLLLMLPWNLRREIESEFAGIRDWGGRFAAPMPKGEVW